jgi:5-methylcytosine-specific restriction endonuclease McrA
MIKKEITKRDISVAKCIHKYLNTEKGFVRNRIRFIFSPSKIRNRGYTSESTKEEILKHFEEHISKYGRNCFYCKEPWTYIVNMHTPGGKGRVKTTTKIYKKNFSIDRLDSSKTYSVSNIVFCCVECNSSKKDVSIKLIKRLYEIITERKL